MSANPPSEPYAARRSQGASSEDVQARQTFLRFCCRPQFTMDQDPDLYRAVLRHAKQIDSYCKRLNYRRSHLGSTLRLIRNPVLGTVIAPPKPPDFPARRVLTLTTLLAVACEEVEGGVTLVKLSDLVAEIAANTDRNIRPYNPDLLSERRSLVKAAALLEFWGVLRKRVTLVADVADWTETRTGIGAGYDVDREALLLFVTPDTIALAAHQQAQLADVSAFDAILDFHESGYNPAQPSTQGDSAAAVWSAQQQSTRVVRHLRTLVETPALLYADLPADEADLARTQRGLRAETVINLIGGAIEARAEGLVWVSREEECPATVNWPTSKTESWAALMAADKAGRDGVRDTSGVVHLDNASVTAVLEDLTEWRGALFRRELRDDPAGLRCAVEDTLRWVGLLHTGPDGSWRLSPLAGRYRDPELVQPTRAPHDDDLFSDEPADSDTWLRPDVADPDQELP